MRALTCVAARVLFSRCVCLVLADAPAREGQVRNQRGGQPPICPRILVPSPGLRHAYLRTYWNTTG
eukprot:808759-Rhodomonas_salina.2